MANLTLWHLLLTVYLLSLINGLSGHRHKRAVNNLGEYIQSIKSLKHKRKEILKFMEEEAHANPENSIHAKIWVKKRSHDLSENVGCAPVGKIWNDIEMNSFESNPTEWSKKNSKVG